jgi:hypothetical protein
MTRVALLPLKAVKTHQKTGAHGAAPRITDIRMRREILLQLRTNATQSDAIEKIS